MYTALPVTAWRSGVITTAAYIFRRASLVFGSSRYWLEQMKRCPGGQW